MRSVKEALKRSHPWSAYYFTNKKGSWYLPTENYIDYRKLPLELLKRDASVYIAISNKENLWT